MRLRTIEIWAATSLFNQKLLTSDSISSTIVAEIYNCQIIKNQKLWMKKFVYNSV